MSKDKKFHSFCGWSQMSLDIPAATSLYKSSTTEDKKKMATYLDDDRCTTLMLVANDYGLDDDADNRLSLAESLLKMGAKVNHKDNFGFTALSLASDRDFTPMVKLLIKYGARHSTSPEETITS
jgi:ankyrin repeat protein